MIDEKLLIERLEENILKYKEDDMAIGINIVREIVNQLAEEHKDGWIPCSERLPEENEYVIASIHPREWVNGGNPVIITRYDSISAWYWNNGIIYGWQPLPAPYQPKGEQP